MEVVVGGYEESSGIAPSPGQTIPFAVSDSQVNVNCVFAGGDFLSACCSRRLIFSWPFEGVVGEAAAFAIAADIMPGSGDWSKSVQISAHSLALNS